MEPEDEPNAEYPRTAEQGTERVRVRRSRPSSHSRASRKSRSANADRAAPTTRRRIAFWTGCGLIAAGLAILAWVAWQFWGTNWQSQRRHTEVSEKLVDGWSQGENVVRTDFGNASAIVRIPRFGKNFKVPVLEGASDEVLAAGVGHMDDTGPGKEVTEPGMPGNYILAGHRVTHGEPFSDFPELRAGDKVIVETRAQTFTYVLDTGGEDLILPFTDTWVLAPRPVNPQTGGVQPPADAGDELITLVTCSEIFHTDNRSVVFGHLTDTSPAQR
ncbi:MAG: class E sortase [Nocardioidaceae bacterium]|nr:class E sortase [Nocardioidaceae bacterium]